MKTYIFLYNETSLFEVDLVAYFMKTKGDVFVITERNKVINTNEGFKILADFTIDEIKIEDIDILVICGGEINNINDVSKLHQLIKKCNDDNKIIGGICAGKDIVANALNISCPEKSMIINNKIVLSPGNEYVDFALLVGKLGNIYQDEADYRETIDYFKLFKNVDRGV